MTHPHKVNYKFNKLGGLGFISWIVIVFLTLGIVAIAQTNFSPRRALQPKALSDIASITRAQQSYFLEQDTFADSIEKLGLAIKTDTETYRYRISPPPITGPFQSRNGKVFSEPLTLNKSVMITAQAINPAMKSYTSAVFVTKLKGEKNPVAVICETESPSRIPPAMPIFTQDKFGQVQSNCLKGSRKLR